MADIDKQLSAAQANTQLPRIDPRRREDWHLEHGLLKTSSRDLSLEATATLAHPLRSSLGFRLFVKPGTDELCYEFTDFAMVLSDLDAVQGFDEQNDRTCAAIASCIRLRQVSTVKHSTYGP